MEYTASENRETFEYLDKVLQDGIDKEIIKDLDPLLEIVKQRSHALASSLKRCFNNARKSMRYVLVYNLGRTGELANRRIGEWEMGKESDEELEKYLIEHLKDHFEKHDFMHYGKFVRLNRACAIDVGGDISSKIKDMYNDYFFGKRLIMAYRLGIEASI